jgi:hypothetical protein
MTTLTQRPIAGLEHDDLVSRDSDLLALHMQSCERARSRFFKLQSAFEIAHGIISPRIFTSAAVIVLCGASIMIFA